MTALAVKPMLLFPVVALAKNQGMDVADMDIGDLVTVRMRSFQVATRLDSGDLAANSVTGSRFDVARYSPGDVQMPRDRFHDPSIFDPIAPPRVLAPAREHFC